MIYWSMAAARQLLQKGSRVTQQSPSCGFLCWGRNALIDSRGSLHLSITPSAASPSQSLSILPLRLSCALQQGEAEGRVSGNFFSHFPGQPIAMPKMDPVNISCISSLWTAAANRAWGTPQPREGPLEPPPPASRPQPQGAAEEQNGGRTSGAGT